jgi:hypothetical protein
MSEYPGVGYPAANQGGSEAMIGRPGRSVPITIDGSDARYGVSASDTEIQTGPRLYARKTATPFGALPFFSNAAMTDITNSTNFVCDVPDALARRFKVGDLVKFYDVSDGALDTGALTSLTIDIVSVAGGGTAGAGFTRITCTGEVFTNTPATADLLVLADGTELSANVVVVAGDITFDGVKDFGSNGFIDGAFNQDLIENATYFVAADNQAISLIEMK